jgi:bla regulator protein blaR1
MMLELTLVAKVTVIFAVAISAAWVARSARASVRSLILASAFAIVFLLPVGSAVAPSRQVEIPVSYPATFFVERTTVGEPAGTAVRSPHLAERARSFSLPSLATTARVAWLSGAVAFVIPLVVGLWRTRRLRRGSRPWDEGRRIASELSGTNRHVGVLLHDQLLAPMTCGWIRPVILMPADASGWAAPDTRQALLHELEHIRRHDWPIQVLARATCALYWFHPAAWFAWRQLRLESERACDDAVVSQVESTGYAEQLVTLARRLTSHDVPLLSMADRRTLSVRVSSILSHTVARGRVDRRELASILFGAVALALVVAPVRAVRTQDLSRDAVRIPVATEGAGFDVASVKPNLPDDRLRVNDWQPATGRLTLRNLTPQTLLSIAYATTATLFLPDDRLVGVPEWAERERFTIEAVAGRPVTTAEMQRMLRRVLVERFGLRVHVEQRAESALRLTMARADRRLGPDLRQADEKTCNAARRPRGGSEAWGPQLLTCTTIDLLALDLSERLGRPVLNQTGLTGIFDGTLSYAPSPEELAVIYRLSPSELPPASMNGPSLPTALREQLGLTLESTRASIDILVVDHIDRPTPNDSPAAEQVPPQATSPSAVPLRFGVASVRPNDGSDPSRGFGFTLQTGRVRLRNQALRTIVSVAYADTFGLWFPDERISGGPPWMNTDRFTIEGRAERAVTGPEMGAMLRTLLAERFNLKVRLQPRQASIYALVRVKRDGTLGPELRVAASECAGGRCGIGGGPGRYQLSGASMPLLAGLLSELAGRPVVDRTGLDGSFDGTLTWSPTPEEIGPQRDAAPAAPAPGVGASIFTALEEQFGLKLQAERGAVNHLIVEHADRPIPNDAPELSPPEP